MSLAQDPSIPFEFEALLEAWRDTGPSPEALFALREFLTQRVRSILEYLPDVQLIDALAAWQREGELLFAQRRWDEAHQHYRDLTTLLHPLEPRLALWCQGAAAECRVESGALLEGIADLAEVLEMLEARRDDAGIRVLEGLIGEAVGRLGEAVDLP